MTIDIDKLKVWLKLKSKECGNADETDDWSWGNKFAKYRLFFQNVNVSVTTKIFCQNKMIMMIWSQQ